MPVDNANEASRHPTARNFWLVAACLVGVLGILFFNSFLPGKIIFSNDGPYGAISSNAGKLPEGLFGGWGDLSWLGNELVSAAPSFSTAISIVLRPLGYAKFAAPIAFLLVGLSAWLLFRQLKLAPLACVLGGLAAALNSDFFSTGCWGVVAQPVCFAACYLALAAVANPAAPHPWCRLILSGFCVGWGVMEAFDVGAIFSVFVAAFVLFQSWNTEDESPAAKRLGRGVLRVAMVAVFAGLIACQTVSNLVNTQISGIVGAAQTTEAKEKQWDFATQWSFPKIEVLQVVIPGIFGFRTDTPDGGSYWGAIGQHPMVPQLLEAARSNDENVRGQALGALGQIAQGGGFRQTGSGTYAGVLVVLLAFWAVCQSFRRSGSPFSLLQRRLIRFWLAVALVALFLGFGKYAPLYRLFYALPYTSTIRNPFKFVHVFNWALLILFAYGVDGLFRNFMRNPVARANGVKARFVAWWVKAPAFDRVWLAGCFAALGGGLPGWLIYDSSKTSLVAYLQKVGFPDVATARAIAHFSLVSVGWGLLFLILTIGLLSLIYSGQFAGPQAKWGGVLLGALLLFDLGRANLPWVIYWDIPHLYASNPVVDRLATAPWENRVAILPDPPFRPPTQEYAMFAGGVYGWLWKQQLFQFYNIQSLDVIQESRLAEDKARFQRAFPLSAFNILRMWELTNTRYLLGPAGEYVQAMNQQLDAGRNRFCAVQSFDLAKKPDSTGREYSDYTVALNPTGQLALIEFTGALPRASLFSNWRTITNDDETLTNLASPAFDPHQTVLVADAIPAPVAANTNQPAGTVQIKSNYQPKRIEMDADVKVPSVLLLNDRYNAKWHITVDGKPEPLLRCNFIMRGVYLQPGKHDVVFRFVTSPTTLYISSAAVAFGLLLCGWVAFTGKPPASPPSPAPTNPGKAAAKTNVKAGAKA